MWNFFSPFSCVWYFLSAPSKELLNQFHVEDMCNMVMDSARKLQIFFIDKCLEYIYNCPCQVQSGFEFKYSGACTWLPPNFIGEGLCGCTEHITLGNKGILIYLKA